MAIDTSAASFGVSNVGFAILMFNCTNWEISDCAFTGIQAYSYGIYANTGDNWSIKDNYFNMATPSTSPNQAINIQNVSGKHQVCRNVCVGTAIFTQSGDGLFEGNIVRDWKFGSGITCNVVSAGPRGTNNRFIGNYCLNGGGNPDVNNTYSHGIENSSGNAVIVGNTCSNNAGAGIDIFGPNCLVAENQCLNNNQALAGLPGIIVYDIPQSSGGNLGGSGSIVAYNMLSDTQGSPTQSYGYAEFNITNGFGTGAIAKMQVAGNRTFGNVTGDYLFAGVNPAPVVTNSGMLLQTMAIPTIASAATIAPTVGINAVSGAATISNITVPPFLPSGASFSIQLLPLAGSTWTTTTGGNIALGSTAVVRKTLIMTYDAAAGLWFPSYT